MNIRRIPHSIPALVTVCARALAGAQSRGETLGLAQNTATRIQTDYYDYVGEPGSEINRGKQAALNAKRNALTQAGAARRAAVAAGRKFCSDGVDLLKPHLGRTWNPRWLAAGFSRFTLATSRIDPLPVLIEFRNYLRDNPAREVPNEGFTLANAEAQVAAVGAAYQALDAAKSARKLAAQQRDGSLRQLRRRLSNLREELGLILSDTDARWYDFGFARPADSKMPEPVTGLIASPGLPGQVLVQHDASARALDYRVSWKVADASGDPAVAGLFADLAVMLSGLPSGVAIEVSVTARNETGETQPASVTIVVP